MPLSWIPFAHCFFCGTRVQRPKIEMRGSAGLLRVADAVILFFVSVPFRLHSIIKTRMVVSRVEVVNKLIFHFQVNIFLASYQESSMRDDLAIDTVPSPWSRAVEDRLR